MNERKGSKQARKEGRKRVSLVSLVGVSLGPPRAPGTDVSQGHPSLRKERHPPFLGRSPQTDRGASFPQNKLQRRGWFGATLGVASPPPNPGGAKGGWKRHVLDVNEQSRPCIGPGEKRNQYPKTASAREILYQCQPAYNMTPFSKNTLS